MANIADKIVGIVKPFADKQGVKLFSVESELKVIGKKLDEKAMTVDEAVREIDSKCERRGCFLEPAEQRKIATALKSLM